MDEKKDISEKVTLNFFQIKVILTVLEESLFESERRSFDFGDVPFDLKSVQFNMKMV